MYTMYAPYKLDIARDPTVTKEKNLVQFHLKELNKVSKHIYLKF